MKNNLNIRIFHKGMLAKFFLLNLISPDPFNWVTRAALLASFAVNTSTFCLRQPKFTVFLSVPPLQKKPAPLVQPNA